MGEPIKIMMIYEKTRGLTEPTLARGATAAVQAVNAAGGVRERPLELIECDTLDDPTTAAACGRKAVSDGVVALVGSLSVHSGEFLPKLEQHRIPSVGLIPATVADFTSPAAFAIVGGPSVSLAFLAGVLADHGARKICLVRPDVARGAALRALADKGIRRVGLEIVNDVAIPSGVADVTPYVEAAREGGTDALLVALAGEDGVRFIVGARRADPALRIAERGADEAALVDVLGDESDGILGSTYFFTPSTKNAATTKYVEDMKAAGFDDAALNGRHAQDTYAAVLVFAAVAEQLPEVTATALFDRLPGIHGLDVLGLPVQFTTGGVGGLPRVFNPCILGTKLERGEPQALTGKFVDAFTGRECASRGEPVT